MSSKNDLVSPYRIEKIAAALGQSESAIKLCLKGPRPNIDTSSIDGIRTIGEAKKMMRRAKANRMRYSTVPGERERLIAKKWFCLCSTLPELSGPFSDEGSPDLYYDIELRHMRDCIAENIADAAIRSENLPIMLECWKQCPTKFVSHKLILTILDQLDSARFGLIVAAELMKSNMVVAEVEPIFWRFMMKIAELIDTTDAKTALDLIIALKRFDHANPAVSLLVRKMSQDHLNC